MTIRRWKLIKCCWDKNRLSMNSNLLPSNKFFRTHLLVNRYLHYLSQLKAGFRHYFKLFIGISGDLRLFKHRLDFKLLIENNFSGRRHSVHHLSWRNGSVWWGVIFVLINTWNAYVGRFTSWWFDCCLWSDTSTYRRDYRGNLTLLDVLISLISNLDYTRQGISIFDINFNTTLHIECRNIRTL